MTPAEISDYKQRWMSSGKNNPVVLHSDKRNIGKDWCKQNLYTHQWKLVEYTDVYEDTFYFEHELFKEFFRIEFIA
jgi:hypothetical protein